MSQDNQKLVNWIKELPVWIKGTIGFITVVVGFVLLWRDNPNIVPPVLLGLFVVGGLLGSLYVAFKRTEPLIERGVGTWQYPYLRRWAIASCILIPLLTAAGISYYFYDKAQPPDKIIIFVADFDGPEPNKYRVTETVLSALRQALKEYDDVTLMALGKTITEQQGSDTARAEGEKQKAAIVIWGWYGVTENTVPLSVHFEILRTPQYFLKLRPEIEGAVRTIDRVELESFDMQTSLSGEMTYLSLFTVGVTRYAANDWDGAIVAFDDALEQTTENVPPVSRSTAYFYLGNTRIANNRTLESSFNPTSGTTHYDDQGLGSVDTAILKAIIADFSKAIELNPDLAMAYYNRGLTRLALGELEGAKDDFTNSINLKDEESDAYNSRGNVYLSLGEIDAAISDFSKAIELNPNLEAYYTNRGNTRYLQGDVNGAIMDYSKALELDPNSINALIGRGNIRQQEQGDLVGAIADFNKALELNPNDPVVYYNRGNAHAIQENIEGAVADYTKAIELDPNFAEPYVGRGHTLHNQQDLEGAIADYNKAIEINPNDPDPYFRRAFARRQQGDLDGAISDYTQAIELDPDFANSYFNRANIYAQKGDHDQAVVDYTQYIQLVPDNAGAYNGRCWGYYELRRYEDALPDCEKAIALDPSNVYALDSRAFVYAALGRTSDAIKEFERILEISTNPEALKRAEEALKKLRGNK